LGLGHKQWLPNQFLFGLLISKTEAFKTGAKDQSRIEFGRNLGQPIELIFFFQQTLPCTRQMYSHHDQ
jgi:hypothetical protein